MVFLSTVDATVSTDAVFDRLLGRLPPDRNELVLVEINRFAVKSKLMFADPGPLTDQLIAKENLPFAFALATNETPETTKVQARRKPQFSPKVSQAEPLNMEWQIDVVSLSHVALPIPPDHP